MKPRLLVVESDPALAEDLIRAAGRAGYAAAATDDRGEALARAAAGGVDVVLLEVSGVAGLAAVQALARRVAVVAAGSRPSLELAIEAMKRGARDFLRKPFALPDLEAALAAAVAARPEKPPGPGILTRDPGMEALLRQAEAAARSEATVQIVGESGTGKDLLARFLHRQSPRRAGALVSVNCAALPETLADSELFGHEAGSFTGATRRRLGQVRAADGGTLLLEQVSEAGDRVQAKLLRLLQEREVQPLGAPAPVPVDVRVLVTSQRDLSEEVERGRLRADLRFRLDVIVLRLPPLRERGADLELLARSFLERFATAAGCEPPQLGADALDRLAAHPFPGNVRELENLMRRSIVLFPGRPIDVAALLERRGQPARLADGALLNLRELERRTILRSLEKTGGNRTHASAALGISVRTLRNKIRRYGLA